MFKTVNIIYDGSKDTLTQEGILEALTLTLRINYDSFMTAPPFLLQNTDTLCHIQYMVHCRCCMSTTIGYSLQNT